MTDTTYCEQAPFDIDIVQVYAPTSVHDDNQVGRFYQQLQEIVD